MPSADATLSPSRNAAPLTRYRCRVAEIRDATWDDFDAVFELLDARSRAAFGVSQVKPEYLRQTAGSCPSTDNGSRSRDGEIVGYAALDADQELVHARRSGGRRRSARACRGAAPACAATGTSRRPRSRKTTALQCAVGAHGFALDREILRMWRPLDGGLPEPRLARTASPCARTTRRRRRGVHALLDEAYARLGRRVRSARARRLARVHDGRRRLRSRRLVARRARRRARRLRAALERARAGWLKDLAVRETSAAAGSARRSSSTAFREFARAARRASG